MSGFVSGWRKHQKQQVETLAREGKHQHLIIESTGISDPTPVAEALVRSERSTDTSEYFLADDDDDEGGGDGGGAGNDVVSSLGQGGLRTSLDGLVRARRGVMFEFRSYRVGRAFLPRLFGRSPTCSAPWRFAGGVRCL